MNGSETSEVGTSSKKLPRRPEETLAQMRYEWGSLDLDTFIQRLREDEGIADAKVEQSSNGYIIHLVSAGFVKNIYSLLPWVFLLNYFSYFSPRKMLSFKLMTNLPTCIAILICGTNYEESSYSA